jgi:uncharacterized protein (DUF4415 family)
MAKRQTPREAAHFTYMMDVMRRLEWDLHNTIAETSRVPEAWHQIAAREKTSRKVKVNLWLEADVVKFLKSMGDGWGPRANDVLKSWMHARIAGVVKGAETLDIWKAREEGFEGEKPGFGYHAGILKLEDETTAPQRLSGAERIRQYRQRRGMGEG